MTSKKELQDQIDKLVAGMDASVKKLMAQLKDLDVHVAAVKDQIKKADIHVSKAQLEKLTAKLQGQVAAVAGEIQKHSGKYKEDIDRIRDKAKVTVAAVKGLKDQIKAVAAAEREKLRSKKV